MSVFAYLHPRRFRHPQPPMRYLEIEFVAGLLTEVGIVTSLVRSLDDAEAQRVVTRCGKYLRHVLEEQLGYDAVESLYCAAGLGSDSHLGPDRWESRASGPDQEDYGRNLEGKQRLADRAQRLDNVVMAIAQFGFEGLRNNREHVCSFLYERRPRAEHFKGQQ